MAQGIDQWAAHDLAMKTHPTFANYELDIVERYFERFNDNWVNYWKKR